MYSCTEHLGNPLSITFPSHGCTPAGGLILLKLADHHLKKCLKSKVWVGVSLLSAVWTRSCWQQPRNAPRFLSPLSFAFGTAAGDNLHGQKTGRRERGWSQQRWGALSSVFPARPRLWKARAARGALPPPALAKPELRCPWGSRAARGAVLTAPGWARARL